LTVARGIAKAPHFSREQVLNGGWHNMARTSAMSELVSQAVADGSPYEHAIRVYAALAKGNLWLFMDIYPWLRFFLEYGINKDGTLNASRLTSHVGQRSCPTLLTTHYAPNHRERRRPIDQAAFPAWVEPRTPQ
jgi:hypothetical protein